MRKIIAVILCVLLCAHPAYAASDEKIDLSAPSVILIEASTGQSIYEENADERLPPASVTKVMTMLLIFDAIEEGKIKMEDSVTVSEYAASMGGSQVFLEPGEVQTVDTMLKCIAVASANDACVAMAEYISGSESEFVNQMNERAQSLGMKNTHFMNCNGLDADGHLTTARDIALMSRELINKHPKVHEYATIWMENITHTTKKGTSEFGLANTNKLIRHYEYATGLKTGSTSKAKFCLSATAKKDGIELIAVIMAAPDSRQRVKDSITLLNHGFSKCRKYADNENFKFTNLKVAHGVEKEVPLHTIDQFIYVDVTGADLTAIQKKIQLKEKLDAPVKEGEQAGEIIYYLGKDKIGSIPIITKTGVKKMEYEDAVKQSLVSFLL